MNCPIFHVNAFASPPARGNPAAVCLLDAPADAPWMQRIAADMNLSETAFLHPIDGGYSLRWFTPAVEVDLCGHATLASAHVLLETGRVKPDDPARFHTRSGWLECRFKSGSAMPVEMDFPVTPAGACDPPAGLLDALRVSHATVARGKFDYLVEAESEAVVRGLQPDHRTLRALNVRGVIVTAKASTPPFDFVSRFFAPGSGIDEDPVTGSAHCTLAAWWAPKLGKSQMTAYQASPRGGVVGVQLAGERVVLRGRAITTLRGELLA